jgi:hypothetical protein
MELISWGPVLTRETSGGVDNIRLGWVRFLQTGTCGSRKVALGQGTGSVSRNLRSDVENQPGEIRFLRTGTGGFLIGLAGTITTPPPGYP